MTDFEDRASHAPILISACLLGEPCRYDGESAPCDTAIALARHYPVVPVCPEQLGGLSTPRTPSEIRNGRVVSAAGEDRTAAFEQGAREALRIAQEHGCTLAILKAKSPSCGCHQIYDGTFSGSLARGMGMTARTLAKADIALMDENDLKLLVANGDLLGGNHEHA